MQKFGALILLVPRYYILNVKQRIVMLKKSLKL